MSKKYLVITSFAGPEVGSCAQGDTIELSDEQARNLAPFIQAMDRIGQKIETADLPVDVAEKAVKKTKAK